MNLKFFAGSILLGAGLAMDAFSVSCANGLNESDMKRGRMNLIAGMYALFQFMMPLIGWFCVRSIADAFEAFRRFIPWIALVLLLFIGGDMLIGGIRGSREEERLEKEELSFGKLILQAVATSIDALSVGFTIASYQAGMALTACLLIGAVTYGICMAGLEIGKKVGTRLTGKASILGGVILIAIGIEIFVTGI